MHAKAQLIETLKASELCQKYERAFTEAIGMPFALRPVESWRLPMRGSPKENKFCAIMGAKSSSCAVCLRTQEELARTAVHEPATVTCAYGLCETAVPLKLGLETIGFLQTGQVMLQKPTDAAFERVRSQAAEFGADTEIEAAREAWFQTPVVSRRKLDSAVGLLSVFAEHLAMQSNQIAVQTANAEPPIVTRAKEFIEEHLAEELSLGRMAKALHTNIFYFCKNFKKGSGLRFTEYVSRTRIEKAKKLLLNPNLRVSEIAFEVGFQSLTHFNRAFKNVAGDSPTGYRQRMPAIGIQPPAGMTGSSPSRENGARLAPHGNHAAGARPPVLVSAGSFLADNARHSLNDPGFRGSGIRAGRTKAAA